MLRFHLDQHVSSAIARGLRLRGVDVTTTAQAQLQHAKDIEHLVFARSGERVIYSSDDDYLRLHSEGHEHAGIVYSKQGTRSIGEVVRYLKLMSDCLEPEDMRNRVEFF